MADKTRDRLVISGPGAADFLTAQGGIDQPGAGKGTSNLKDQGIADDTPRLEPALEADEDEKKPTL